MTPRFALLAAACGLALATAPAGAQNKIAVTPAKIDVARGSSTAFTVQKDVGQGWQASTPDEWYTLVEPAKLGVFKIVGASLVFEAEMAGSGELHVWHKTKLSWSGLYAKIPVTVREAAAPVPPTPPPVRPTPPVPVPPKPTPAGTTLDVFRMGTVPPRWIDPAVELAIAPGESVALSAHLSQAPARALDIVPATEPGLAARVEAGRVVVELQRGTPVGTRIELSLRCRTTGASTRLRFVAGAAGAAPAAIRVWIRRGFDGAWQPLATESGITLRPGGVVFIAAEAVCALGRPAVGSVELALADSPDFGLRAIGPGLWLVASGAPTRFDVKATISAKVASTTVVRAIALTFGE